VGHPVIARIDKEAAHPPDLAIDGMDPIPWPHLVLTHRNNVFDERPPASRNGPMSMNAPPTGANASPPTL
jgi:hypothetical protein